MSETNALKVLDNIIKSNPEILVLILKKFSLSENKHEILTLLSKEGSLNITQIQQRVNLAYKNVLAHIKKLEEMGLVKTEKQEKERGREVIVSYNSENVKKRFRDSSILTKWAGKLLK